MCTDPISHVDFGMRLERHHPTMSTLWGHVHRSNRDREREREYQEVWKKKIMKCAARFMISWFVMKMVEQKIVSNQLIIYADAFGIIILHIICYQGNNQPLLAQTSYKK